MGGANGIDAAGESGSGGASSDGGAGHDGGPLADAGAGGAGNGGSAGMADGGVNPSPGKSGCGCELSGGRFGAGSLAPVLALAAVLARGVRGGVVGPERQVAR